MTYRELKDALKNRTGLSHKRVDLVIKEFVNVVENELINGGDLALPGLGRFKTKQYGAREGRNPQTGEKMHIPASKRPRFVFFDGIKKVLNI